MFSHPTPPKKKINIMRKINALKRCSRLKDNFVTVGYELKFLARLFCGGYYQRWCLSRRCLANKTEGRLCLCLWRHDAVHHCNWMYADEGGEDAEWPEPCSALTWYNALSAHAAGAVHMHPAQVNKEEAVMSKLNVWDLLFYVQQSHR